MQATEKLQQQLIALEKKLFEPGIRASREALSELLSEEFSEIAASGHQFGLSDALARVPSEVPPVIRTGVFSARLLSSGLAQVSYRAAMKKAQDTCYQYSLRSSLWQQNGSKWQMVFHQGTPTAPFDLP